MAGGGPGDSYGQRREREERPPGALPAITIYSGQNPSAGRPRGGAFGHGLGRLQGTLRPEPRPGPPPPAPRDPPRGLETLTASS